MSATQEVLLILGMTLVTFGVRYPVLALVGRIELPDNLFRALRFVPVAVLTAIIVPEAALTEGRLDFSLSNAALFASVIAVGIAWRTQKLVPTIVLGMLAFFAWRALFR